MTDFNGLPTTDENNALARLRLFLAPHALTPDNRDQDKSDESRSRTSSFHLETIHSDTPTISGSNPKFDETNHTVGWRIPPDGATYSEFTTAAIRPLSGSSKDYAKVRYLLQASLPGYRVDDHVLIWDMRNAAMTSQYEQHTSGFLELDSWVAIDEFGEENCMQDVYSGGFQMPRNGQGMKFTTGNILIQNSTAQGSQQFVLCKIAVGRSSVITSAADITELPQGYNSFYIRHPPAPPTAECDTQNNSVPFKSEQYIHQYIINDPMQILPQYLVQFKYSKVESTANYLSRCGLCEKQQARVSCKACEAYLCEKCDQEVHGANKLVGRHKRVAVNNPAVENDPDNDEKNEINRRSFGLDSTCSKHKDMSVEFYCPACCIPVCIHCKMVGDHSCGEAASHRLVSIMDAYEGAVSESQKTDALIESRLEVIQGKLRIIELRGNEIRENSAQIEKSIYKVLQDALQTLHNETESKLGVLLGEELELCRQVQQIKWAEAFLAHQRRELGPVEFLDGWQNHKVLRSELRDFPVMHLPCAEKVKADIQLVGRVQVITGETLPFQQEKNMNHPIDTKIDYRRKLLLGSKSVSTNEDSYSANKVMSVESSEIIEKVRKELQNGKGTKTIRGFYWSQDKKDLSSTTNEQHPALGSISPRNGLPFTSTLRENKLHSEMNPQIKQNTINDIWTKQLRQEMGVK